MTEPARPPEPLRPPDPRPPEPLRPGVPLRLSLARQHRICDFHKISNRIVKGQICRARSREWEGKAHGAEIVAPRRRQQAAKEGKHMFSADG